MAGDLRYSQAVAGDLRYPQVVAGILKYSQAVAGVLSPAGGFVPLPLDPGVGERSCGLVEFSAVHVRLLPSPSVKVRVARNH